MAYGVLLRKLPQAKNIANLFHRREVIQLLRNALSEPIQCCFSVFYAARHMLYLFDICFPAPDLFGSRRRGPGAGVPAPGVRRRGDRRRRSRGRKVIILEVLIVIVIVMIVIILVIIIIIHE